ncbi:MAG: hypothetical protein IIC55_08685 [Proteobacteria bacterium]|nr:hypothetical protein [Pseudomonadota bacterium]
MGSRQKLRAVVIEANPEFPLLSERREIQVVGRFAQTLRALVEAGPKGVTALDLAHWAVRLSHYVWVLRHRHGLHIDMIEEAHGGDYPGKHGRYFLRTTVELIDAGDGGPVVDTTTCHGRAAA